MKPVQLNVPHVQQREGGDCVVACAAMALDHLGVAIAYGQIKRILQTEWFGTPSFYIRKLEQLGLVVIYKRRANLQEIHEHLLNNRPGIVFVRTSELPYWSDTTDHAVVVIGLDESAVYLNDPAFPEAPPKSFAWRLWVSLVRTQ